MKPPHENFKCCDCTVLREHWDGPYDSYYRCPKHKDRGNCYTEKACQDFNPKDTVKDSYRICVLELKVEELTNVIQVIKNND